MRMLKNTIHIYMAIAFLTAAAVITAIAINGANRQNSQVLAAQQIIANSETDNGYDYLKGQLRPMAYWQDSFEHTSRKWDDKWVAYQFGEYENAMGNRRTAIVGQDGTLKFLHVPESERKDIAANFARAKGMSALLAKVRDEQMRQPPRIITGAFVSNGKAYFAVAAAITPENPEDLAIANRTPFTVIFFKPVTAAGYDEFSAGFASDDIHIALGGPLQKAYKQYAIADAAGNPVAWLRWKPRLPGDDFLQSLLIPSAAALLILLLVQALVINHWQALQRRNLQADIETAAAQEQSRLKSVFLGMISHELCAPLNAIIGSADALCHKTFGPLGSQSNEDTVLNIRTSGQHLLKSVQNLIEITRNEARGIVNTDDIFDVSVAAEKAIRTVHDQARSRDVTIVLSQPEHTITCRGSLQGLTQAMERLLGNAIRHSPASGRVELKITQAAGNIQIDIADKGDGIAHHRLADLSRPFGHPDDDLTGADANGLGLGIPIAKGLVQFMGGTVTITSKKGVGTGVCIRLPADSAKT